MIKGLIPRIRKNTKLLSALRFITVVLIVVNLVFIWCNSSKVSKESDKTSKKLATSVAEIVVEDYENLSRPQQNKHVARLNIKIRSMGHFMEFVPLGFLLFMLAVTLFDFREKKLLNVFAFCLVFSLCLSALFALSDEIHQLFVKGRTFQAEDILTDTLGAFSGCIVSSIVTFIFKKKIL